MIVIVVINYSNSDTVSKGQVKRVEKLFGKMTFEYAFFLLGASLMKRAPVRARKI